MKYIFANWKMYLDYFEAQKLAAALAREEFNKEKVAVAVFPNVINFAEAAEAFAGKGIAIGAQNVGWTPLGAYTGAVSAFLFKQAGAKYALVGHSERRHIFGETEGDTRKKVEACLNEDIIPVLCVGESAKDLEEGKREYRLKKQLFKVFEGLEIKHGQQIIIAYEPVWAISQSGSGNPCTPADADDVIGWIKNELKQYTGEVIPALYGGSVNARNVLSYVEREVIDGVLAGSASTKFDEFLKIIKIVENYIE